MISSFLQTQMDYIFFFYGLGFILLAAVTWPMSGKEDPLPWGWLCLFGLTHGASEWLDMLAFGLGDAPAFAAVRLGLMALSFLFLLEFGRSGAQGPDGRAMGPWIYLPLLVLASLGSLAGLSGLNVSIRYALGLTGTLGAALAFRQYRRAVHPGSRPLLITGLAMGIYGFATGIVVPEAPFFPASLLNQPSFFATTGLPIQLLRGMLACTMAAAVWQHSCLRRREALKDVLTPAAFRYEAWMTGTVAAILVAAWIMTQAFGNFGRKHDEEGYRSRLELARSHLENNAEIASNLARTLAVSPTLTGRGEKRDLAAMNATLDRYARVVRGSICYVLDASGTALATSNRDTPESFVGHSYAVRPYFKEAMAGRQGRYVAMGLTSKVPGFYAGAPIRDAGGGIIGAAVVKLTLDKTFLAPFSMNYAFLVDTNGVIIGSTQPGYLLKPLRSLPQDVRQRLVERQDFPAISEASVLPAGLAPGTPFTFQGQRLQSFEETTSLLGLSFVLLGSMTSFVLARLVAILITLLRAVLVITFFVVQQRSRESSVRIAASEWLHHTVLKTIPDLVWLKNKEGVFLACNPKFESLFGAGEADIIGKTDYDFVERELADFFVGHDRKVMAGGAPSSNEEWLTFAEDGHCALHETIKTPMYDEKGALIGVLGIARDITEREQAKEEKARLETRLRQAQKLESIGVLAGGIAHDFNNILSAILGFTELARDSNPSNRQLQEDLGEIHTAANRAKVLVQQIQTFSRKGMPSLSAVDISNVIREALELLRSTVPSSIAVEADINEPVGPVLAAPENIRQIIMNLCTNALQSMEDGGLLTVRVSEEPPSDEFSGINPHLARKRLVKIEIQDTGTGIAPEIMGSIFDPYFTTKNHGDGTGLGLAATYGMVQEMGGDITVASEPGKGSLFTVLLPVTARGEHDGAGESDSFTESPSGENEHILLVDDEPQILTFITRILEGAGYTVTTAQDGQSALELFKHNPLAVDLVISDLTMPKLSGDRLAREILDILPTMPILLTSGYSEKDAEESMVRIGIRGILKKPVSKEQLLRKVRQVLK